MRARIPFGVRAVGGGEIQEEAVLLQVYYCRPPPTLLEPSSSRRGDVVCPCIIKDKEGETERRTEEEGL